jgi:predicted metal-binding membrane protein
MLLSSDLAMSSAWLGAAVLSLAGVYQLTPLKDACLRRCQSPLGFLLGHWRDGVRGALGMGVRHGAFCLGCCWALMALLFVGGVMNLAWVAALAVFVLAEKALARGRWLSRVSGVVLILWAVWLAAHGVRAG